ncbi:MAG: 6-phospho-3-hexuloisomerase [Eubacteriaceae bacterium]|jgi:6-phospho-3-hexuloisomerase
MKYGNLSKVIDELAKFSTKVMQEDADKVLSEILNANKIFVAGAGRSGFAARGFANRLAHLGFNVSFVGEPTTPPIKKGDLLLIGSGSGTTGSLVKMAETAKKQSARLATVTIAPDNTIGSMADAVIVLPGTTRQLVDGEADDQGSIQPVGTMFEQMSWLVYDSLVLDLLKETDQTFDDLLARHGNLE